VNVTRRYWAVAGVGLVLVICSIGFDRPILLFVAATVGGWLLAEQYRFVRTAITLQPTLDVRLTLSSSKVPVETPIDATLEGTVQSTSQATSVRIVADPPVTVQAPEEAHRSVELTHNNKTGTTTFELITSIAGTYAFSPVRVIVTDRWGLFEEQFERPVDCEVRVLTKPTPDVHVGKGGEPIAHAYGNHESGAVGIGIEPASIREYQPDDPAKHIDWKASTRLDDLYVRTFETELDAPTVLLLDHRGTLGEGVLDETKLDLLREVALGIVTNAREAQDPLGLYAAGSRGVTAGFRLTSGREHYQQIQDVITTLQPERDGPVTQSTPRGRTASDARTIDRRLEADDSPFAARVQPFVQSPRWYLEQVADQPLFSAAETYLRQSQRSTRVFVLTDDTRKRELMEVARTARRAGNVVTVLLTPGALFGDSTLLNAESAYEQYREFEMFRRKLDSLERVSAFEVAPQRRLQTVIREIRQRKELSRT
jgi:uncharacterized protein (DUF58 family)